MYCNVFLTVRLTVETMKFTEFKLIVNRTIDYLIFCVFPLPSESFCSGNVRCYMTTIPICAIFMLLKRNNRKILQILKNRKKKGLQVAQSVKL